ncbi:flippase [Fusobacterium sp. 1001295B_180824_G3]|uniref:flippase n=1 Tax=Fusobacterium sp. 1001295B_180824_G3 TaxID=2787123 RepID=UPI00189A2B45|nr:flippase [Fusobacterium sp. 1001295B_180824_G3]
MENIKQIKTIKLNFILNLIRLFLGTAFVVIITPYITRILGPKNLGKVEYVNSIITYFILFTVLGIPSYGIREVAKYRDNKKKLTRILAELLLIILITTTIGYVVLFSFIYFNKNFFDIKDILLVMSINIICNNIGFEWFYQGIEDQIYITKRFILVRVLTLIALFLFVKNKDNYLIYAFILVMMQSGSNILNFINLKKYINFKDIKISKLRIIRRLKPIFIIFSATIATAIYLQLDSVMIGNVNREAVGIYIVPNKLIRMILVIITALGSVLLPRITNCLKNKDYKNYNVYMNNSLNYIFFMSIPLAVSTFLLADNIIYIMAGSQFKESILTMKILSPILFTIGIAYFLGFQLLYPLGLEKYYTYSVIVAAIVNFIFNYLMIPKYLQNGAAVGTVIAETIGPLITLYYSRKYLKKIKFFSRKRLKYFVATLIMGLVIIFIKKFEVNSIKIILYSFIFGGITYIGVLLLLKEEICMEGIKIIKKKVKNT